MKVRIAGRVHDEHVSVISGSGGHKIPRVLKKESAAAACGSDVVITPSGRGSAKNPESLGGGVVLAGIDVNAQLRLVLFDGNKRRKHRNH